MMKLTRQFACLALLAMLAGSTAVADAVRPFVWVRASDALTLDSVSWQSAVWGSDFTGYGSAVVCGDLVNNPTDPHYRLLFEAARRSAPGVPVLTVPGNHDFDLGRDVAEARARQSNFPWVACNLIEIETGQVVPWCVPTLMLDVPPEVAPILYAVPAQLLAYHTAVTKGTDVDQPRNLAKSVTVE